MLKAALLGLCKDKQFDILDGFIPLFHPIPTTSTANLTKSPQKENLDISCDYSESQTSPMKSSKRRGRDQRQRSPSRKENQFPTEISPNFKEYLPLQMQNRSRPPTATDDTLVFDKSIEILHKQHNMHTVNQDSMLLCSALMQPQGFGTKEDEEDNDDMDCSIKDTSQIQIKYAKMLEELENESVNMSPERNELSLMGRVGEGVM